MMHKHIDYRLIAETEASEKRGRLFNKLKHKLHYLDSAKVNEIYAAYCVAYDAHAGQKRHTGELYITHPVAVACNLADMQMDHQSIMAALMHDLIEDTAVDKKMITQQFGQQVADLVDGVTKLGKIEFQSQELAQAENFRKMVLAMSKDIRVIIVKLADRLHNASTLGPLPDDKRRRIAKETLEIYAPIANRLGIHDIAVQLQDFGFAALYPKRYKAIKESIETGVKKRNFLANVEKIIENGLKAAGIKDFQVLGREKHLYSIYKKMRDRHIAFNEIMDVYACRIIVNTIDDCYRVLGIAHRLFKPIPARFKDYIAIPKANGYQSLHTVLFGAQGTPIELQIRTKEMNAWASHGIAAHWMYKSDVKVKDEPQMRAQEWVKNLLDMQKRAGNSLEFIENVKIDLFPDEVYVFTPQGSILELPKGATPVDFAYAVHTDVGHACVAAKVNRQLVPLSTRLRSGQTVEVMTAKAAHPNPAWLDFVVTGKARSGIRHFLKTQRRSSSITLGKKLLKKALQTHQLSLRKISAAQLDMALKQLQFTHFNDLLEEIGLGNRLAIVVAQQISAFLKDEALLADDETLVEKPLEIKGTEGMVISFATCCYPIPGDPVVGILQAGKGITIHCEDCSQTEKLRRNPEKCVSVCWAEAVEGEYPVLINIEIINQRGTLAALAMAITEEKSNIDDIHVFDRGENNFQLTLLIRVQGREHLAAVIRALKQLDFVTKVNRK